MRIHTWEYTTLVIAKVITLNELVELMNNLGQSGWEPCADSSLAMIDLADYGESVYHVLWFKRPTGYIDYEVAKSDPYRYYE